MNQFSQTELDVDAPPQGFTLLEGRAPIELALGPFYERRTAADRWQLGFRVTAAKLNPKGVCHGGVLATFADIQGTAVKKTIGLHAPSVTINLALDFVAPAPEGSWVQAEPDLIRRTGSLMFIHAILYADDTICARASGIYRLLKPQDQA